MENGKGLLDGVVVLDLGRVLACPYAAVLLADMGATVIKIENPKGGDDTRKMGPFINGNSVYYTNFNRSKVGITLNLKEPEGKEIFKEMVKKADVVLENYRPGTMEKLGLGYDVLKEINPGIVYGSVSGFGHTGPLSKRAGYDIVGQAMGGLMSTSGWPGGPATRSGTPLGDVLGALNMTVGVLAALVNKQKTGLGEKVDVALVDSVAAAMENITMIYQSTGRIPQRIGNRYESTYPYDTFPTKDGDVVIAAGNNKLYGILCDVMGRPELKTDPRFLEVKDRVANHDALRDEIVPWTQQHTIDEVDKLLNDGGCPACPVDAVDVAPGLGIAGVVTLDGTAWRVALGNVAFMEQNRIAPDAAVLERLASLAEAGQTPLLLALAPARAALAAAGDDDSARWQWDDLQIAGILSLADALRPESAAVVARLHEMGIRVVMLTGDNERTARAVARQAGLADADVAAGLLPAEKAERIRRLQAEGLLVAMVGDGINDAPALAVADVGMAVGSGVDVSAEAGDIVLMRGGMDAVLTALALSRATMRNIRQNLGWAFGYNLLGLPVAAGLLHVFGGPMLSPMIAGTAMALSSFSVVSNALRLRFFKV